MCSLTSIMLIAMLEQWSLTRSKSVIRSDQTNPVSTVQAPLFSLVMWLLRRIVRKWSITCSSGSTLKAIALSLFTNAFSVKSSISLVAEHKTEISSLAMDENSIPFSRSSSTDSNTFTAWSEMRSRSPITFSSCVTFALSSSETWL